MNILLRFFRDYALRYWPYYLVGVLALFATNYLTVLIPELIQLAIDALEEGDNTEFAIRQAQLILPVALGIVVARTLSRVLFFNPGRAIEFNFKNHLFRHLLSLPRSFYDHHAVGDLTSRSTNDVNYIRGLVGFATLQTANAVIALPLTLWKMWEMSPSLTLQSLIPMAVAMVLLWLSIRVLSVSYRESLEQLSDLSDHILETYNAMPIVQGWNALPAFLSLYRERNNRYTKTQLKISAIRSFLIPLVYLMASLAMVGILWFGGKSVIEGSLTIGVLAAFASYITLLVGQFLSFGWTLNVLQRGYLALQRIYSVIDTPAFEGPQKDLPMPEEVPGRSGSKGYRIEVKDLSFAYPEQDGRALALEGVSFKVEPGETLGIFGPTGSGKTSLVQVLARVYNPPRGTVTINGVDILDINLPQLRDEVALIPQDPFLFSRSLRDNIVWGGEDPEESPEDLDVRVRKAVDMACLTGDLVKLPDGLDTTVGSRGITLSGGQRQRTALARAFFSPFRILLLDDVLSAVDHATEQQLIGHIYEAAKDQTTLLVAHRLSVLEHADRILVLDDGHAIDCAPHQTLMERCPPYADAWRAQQERPPSEETTPLLQPEGGDYGV